MPRQQPASDRIPTEHLTRAAGAIALAAAAMLMTVPEPRVWALSAEPKITAPTR
jgi:hypothetical protein